MKILKLILIWLAVVAVLLWVGWMVNYQLLKYFLTGLGVDYDPEKLWLSAACVTAWTASASTAIGRGIRR